MRGKTVSFDEAIQLKMLILALFLIIFTGLPRRFAPRNDGDGSGIHDQKIIYKLI
ncbi:hypothetical protein [Rickettsia felis]|uniref:hypothetical protein n=1 Tax=Rickettsia felis TaxID=42862 RepID=UPI000ADA1707|nr:hypothetical protein [Rickettsia felis]